MKRSLREQWKDKIPKSYWNDYSPTHEAINASAERIAKRLLGDKS